MTKEQLWAAYVARNPSFSGEGSITMSAAGLRKLFNNTWDMAESGGYSKGMKFQDALESINPDNYARTKDSWSHIFDEFLKGKNK